MPFTVVSFYTLKTPYEDEVETLIASCERFGLMHDIRGVPNQGSWLANCAYKAEFLEAVRDELDGPIVWLDADAEVKQYPVAFDVLSGSADVAVHYKDGKELLSGTVWLDDSRGARRLLAAWTERCRRKPDVWDQKHLQDAVGVVSGLSLHRLPAPYCLIYDSMAKYGPAVIEHHQASRRLKGV